MPAINLSFLFPCIPCCKGQEGQEENRRSNDPTTPLTKADFDSTPILPHTIQDSLDSKGQAHQTQPLAPRSIDFQDEDCQGSAAFEERTAAAMLTLPEAEELDQDLIISNQILASMRRNCVESRNNDDDAASTRSDSTTRTDGSDIGKREQAKQDWMKYATRKNDCLPIHIKEGFEAYVYQDNKCFLLKKIIWSGPYSKKGKSKFFELEIIHLIMTSKVKEDIQKVDIAPSVANELKTEDIIKGLLIHEVTPIAFHTPEMLVILQCSKFCESSIQSDLAQLGKSGHLAVQEQQEWQKPAWFISRAKKKLNIEDILSKDQIAQHLKQILASDSEALPPFYHAASENEPIDVVIGGDTFQALSFKA